jgi:hypothetical protein
MSDIDIRERIRREMLEQFEHGFPTVSISPLDTRLKKMILKTGVGIFGGGGTGKSNLAKVIASELLTYDNVQLKIIDKVQNWVHGFEPILYQDLDENNIGENMTYMDAESILYNTKFTNPDMLKRWVSEMVGFDYELQWRFKEANVMNNWIVYIIEEAQSILANVGSKDVWNTYISEGRNFNMSFIFIARRMTQLNAKLRENMGGFIFARMSGYNNLRRVRAVTNKEVSEIVPTLPLGDYIYWDGMDAYMINDTPLYETDTRPRRWTP